MQEPAATLRMAKGTVCEVTVFSGPISWSAGSPVSCVSPEGVSQEELPRRRQNSLRNKGKAPHVFLGKSAYEAQKQLDDNPVVRDNSAAGTHLNCYLGTSS